MLFSVTTNIKAQVCYSVYKLNSVTRFFGMSNQCSSLLSAMTALKLELFAGHIFPVANDVLFMQNWGEIMVQH